MAKVLGVEIASIEMNEVLEKIEKQPQGKPFWIVTANPEILLLAQEDPSYKEILKQADLVIADGVGLKLVHPELKRLRGRELVVGMIEKGLKIFYLGGQDGVAQMMADKFGGQADSGEIDINNPQRNEEILRKINNYKPDLLLVAYGAPAQERWIYNNRSQIDSKAIMGVGGTFDYLTGKRPLPPRLIANFGLEWLWRLATQPWRWKRIWRAVVVFPWVVYRQRV